MTAPLVKVKGTEGGGRLAIYRALSPLPFLFPAEAACRFPPQLRSRGFVFAVAFPPFDGEIVLLEGKESSELRLEERGSFAGYAPSLLTERWLLAGLQHCQKFHWLLIGNRHP